MSIAPERILYKDEHLLIVNKLAGELVVAAGRKGPAFAEPTSPSLRSASYGRQARLRGPGATAGKKLPLFDFLRKDYPGLRVLHRLDFGTSGIIVFARTAEAVRKVRETKFGGWQKCYCALVAGKLERKEGIIRKPLRARTHEGLVPAVTHYRVLAAFPEATYVEARIETGRKHQIRQHFAAIGHPLLLDPLYGDRKKDAAFRRRLHYRRFFLHASSLTFPHPVTGKMLSITAALPLAFGNALSGLHAVS